MGKTVLARLDIPQPLHTLLGGLYGSIGVPAAQAVDELDPLGQVRKQDLILPTRKLVQPVSRMDGASKHSGEFWDNLSGEYKTQLRVAILKLSYSRALFAKGGFDAPPICASDNAIAPRSRVEFEGQTTGPACDVCPFSEWGSAGEGRRGQACRESRNLLCLDLDTADPFLLSISGVNIKPWSAFATSRGRTGQGFLAAETIIASVIQKFDAGQAFVVTFKTGKKLDDEATARVRQLASRYVDLALDLDEEPEPPEDELPLGGS